MTIETDLDVSASAVKKDSKAILFSLQLKRVPTGIQVHFKGSLLEEYFAGAKSPDEVTLINWKDSEGQAMKFKKLILSRLPAEITQDCDWRTADAQLFANGYPCYSWLGCSSYPVTIQGVYTQLQLDRYASSFTALMKKLYLGVLKPYDKTVTMTYSTD